ncbi:uncharacterized protein B0H64DRAFT_81462 [Chaetomium fimeti]|uniref:Uncharacterized protein n=1 Tax=Chaetomium fimeti TaxID=1854472 RepID=A0AAE0HLI7_9PEZI|nr:hypothetical protein B0H64DRAFT_81462 [Chaetomium fimeti]
MSNAKARAHARSLSATLPISRCRARSGPFLLCLSVSQSNGKAREWGRPAGQRGGPRRSKVPDRCPLARGKGSGPAGQGLRAENECLKPSSSSQISLFPLRPVATKIGRNADSTRGVERKDDDLSRIFLFRQKPGCPALAFCKWQTPSEAAANDSASGSGERADGQTGRLQVVRETGAMGASRQLQPRTAASHSRIS